MKIILLVCLITINYYVLQAEEPSNQAQTHKEIETIINENQQKKIEVMSVNGAVTRAECPYTCEMRTLPKEHCKTWVSTSNPSLCYLWDTRLPQDTVRVRN